MTEQEAFDRCKDNLRAQVERFVDRALPLFVGKPTSHPRTDEMRRLEGREYMRRLLSGLIDHQILPTSGWYTMSYSSRLEVMILRTERDGVVDFHGSMRVVLEEAVTQVRVE